LLQLSRDHVAFFHALQDAEAKATLALESLKQFLRNMKSLIDAIAVIHSLASAVKSQDTPESRNSSKQSDGFSSAEKLAEMAMVSGVGKHAVDAMQWGLQYPLQQAERGLRQLSAGLDRRDRVKSELQVAARDLEQLQRSAQSTAHRFARGIQSKLSASLRAVARPVSGAASAN